MKRFISLLLVVVLILSVSIIVDATDAELPFEDVFTDEKVSPTTGIHKNDYISDEKVVEKTIFDNEFLASLGNIVVKDTIEYNGKSYGLYPVYENQEEALNKFISLYEKEIDILVAKGTEYEQKKLDIKTNWLDYIGIAAGNAQTATNSVDSERWFQVVQFMDVYSGYSRNQRIMDFIADTQTRAELSPEEYEARLACLMPYTSELYINYNNAKVSASSTRATRAWNTTNATAYAAIYAEPFSINPAYRYFQVSGDCTNFASQIRFAGGQPMTSNWFYHYPGIGVGVGYSVSWGSADDFVRMLGTTLTTSIFTTFSAYIWAGRFIAADWTGNGSFDHVGYVTEADNYAADWLVTDSGGTPHGTLLYYDFKVAQHTNDYNQWCSGGNNINGWDYTTIGSPGIKYAVCVAGA